jgi:hypothetical protein
VTRVEWLLADVPAALQQQISNGSWRGAPHGEDVIVLVKRHVAASELAQCPLLAMPFCKRDVQHLVPPDHLVRPCKKVSDESRKEWLGLADTVLQLYGPRYQPAAEYLRDLVEQKEFHSAALHPLEWHKSPPSTGLEVPAGEYVPPACLVDTLAPSVPLRAVFRRGRQES